MNQLQRSWLLAYAVARLLVYVSDVYDEEGSVFVCVLVYQRRETDGFDCLCVTAALLRTPTQFLFRDSVDFACTVPTTWKHWGN